MDQPTFKRDQRVTLDGRPGTVVADKEFHVWGFDKAARQRHKVQRTWVMFDGARQRIDVAVPDLRPA